MTMVLEEARPIVRPRCTKYSSGVPDSLSTNSVSFAVGDVGLWPGVLMKVQGDENFYPKPTSDEIISSAPVAGNDELEFLHRKVL